MNRVAVFLVLLVMLWLGLRHFSTKGSAMDVEVENTRVRLYLMEWERDMKDAGLDPAPALDRLRSITVINTTDWAGMYDTSDNVIYISAHQLSRGEASLKATVYHELGHMAFKLEHGDCGIMYPTCGTDEYYSQNWNMLLKEYISKCYERRWESL